MQEQQIDEQLTKNKEPVVDPAVGIAPDAPTPDTAAEEPAPEVQAAMFIHTALPKFRKQMDKVTGVQAKRVLEALIESPLEKEVPGFTTKEAHELFNLGTMIQNAKFILFQVSLKDEKIVEEVQQQAVEENKSDNKEGESNG